MSTSAEISHLASSHRTQFEWRNWSSARRSSTCHQQLVSSSCIAPPLLLPHRSHQWEYCLWLTRKSVSISDLHSFSSYLVSKYRVRPIQQLQWCFQQHPYSRMICITKIVALNEIVVDNDGWCRSILPQCSTTTEDYWNKRSWVHIWSEESLEYCTTVRLININELMAFR